MTISKERLDELLQGCEQPEDMVGDTGLLKELKIKLMERRRAPANPATLQPPIEQAFAKAQTPGAQNTGTLPRQPLMCCRINGLRTIGIDEPKRPRQHGLHHEAMAQRAKCACVMPKGTKSVRRTAETSPKAPKTPHPI